MVRNRKLEGDTLIGFVEGFLEKWNNRYRISNIVVFDAKVRGKGVGRTLLDTIIKEAVASGARMAVLETQSYNSTLRQADWSNKGIVDACMYGLLREDDMRL